MGHLDKIGYERETGNVLSKRYCKLIARVFVILGRKDLFQIDGFSLVIGYLYAYDCLPWDGRYDPDAGGPEGQGQVVSQAGNLAYLDPRSRLILVHGYYRPGKDLNHLSFDPKVAQFLLQAPGIHLQTFLLDLRGPLRGRVVQEVQRGQFEISGHIHEGKGFLFRLFDRLLLRSGNFYLFLLPLAVLFKGGHPDLFLSPLFHPFDVVFFKASEK